MQTSAHTAAATGAPGVVIYGPQGSGKSLHAETFRRHYGMRYLLDGDNFPWQSDWRPGDPIPADTLVLTHEFDERAIHIDDACNAVFGAAK